MELSPRQFRWHGFDLLRLVSFFAIITFHSSLFYFYSPSIEFANFSPIIRAVDTTCRVFAFSGFTIVFMSSLLLGFSRYAKAKRERIILVLLFGWIYLSMLMNDDFFLVWDVYTLFMCAMLLIMWMERAGPRWVPAAGALGFVLLWLPIWKWPGLFSWVPDSLKYAVGVASCEGREINEWPALPWIGLIWMGYATGTYLVKLRDTQQFSKLQLKRPESLVWIILLALSIPQWGAYFRVRLGEYFACDAYRQEPYVFWSHFIWVLAFLRLSVDPRVQSWLTKKSWVWTISNLAISRKFWLAYAVHYIYGNLISLILEKMGTHIPGFYENYELLIVEFLSVTLILQNEILTRWAIVILEKLTKLLRTQTAPSPDPLHPSKTPQELIL